MRVLKKKLVTFYRKIIQNIFKLIYGKVEVVLNPDNNNEIVRVDRYYDKEIDPINYNYKTQLVKNIL